MRKLIFAAVIFSVALGTATLLAQSTPTIAGYFLDGQSSNNVKLNPNGSQTVEIRLEANLPVKFNTVAVCSVSDTTCSRSTAVKYFIQTSSFGTSFIRPWDGKNSSNNIVADGNYKIKATIKDESGIEASPELSVPLLTIDSTFEAGGENPPDNTDSDQNQGDNSSSDDGVDSSAVSSHTATASTASRASKVSVSAGRKRLVSIGAPVEFRATATGFRDNDGSVVLLWSFGDGAQSYGKIVRHIYLLPGVYQVVLTANQGDQNQAVARTSVEVIKPAIRITNISPEFIALQNAGRQEVNLTYWKLRARGRDFIFPADTIISAGGKLDLPSAISQLLVTASEPVALYYPDGQLATELIGVPPGDQSNLMPVASVLAAIRAKQRPVAVASQAPPPPPVSQTPVVLPNQKTITLDQPAAKRWWQKLFSL